MAVINKSSLVTQLQTFINGLTVESETTQNLLAYLKSAELIGANADTIISQLQTLISTVGTSAEIEEAVLLCVAVSLLTNNRENSVATIGDLPATASPGSIYLVDSEGLPYIRRINGTWTIIDPTLHPKQLENAWTWGIGTSGQLGDNSGVNKSSPVSVVGGFTDWVQIVGGGNHTAASRANGTAWAWGSNSFGQLGDNSTSGRISPVSIVGGFTDWVQISAAIGGNHTAALRANGTVWAWGLNTGGQLGDNTTINKSSPVSVIGGFTDWVQISTGGNQTAALRANGTAWAWGSNNSGQLGDNTTINKSSPVSVIGGFTDWVQISASNLHIASVRANGTAWAWGNNASGRIGDNTTANKSSPVSVVGGFTDWVQIVGGGQHTAALRANGTAWTWGRNQYAQLGDNTILNRSSPVSVVGGFTDWAQIGAGDNFTAALRANGTAWTWGRNNEGQLGDNTTDNKSSPVSVVGGFTDWVQVTGGNNHVAAIRVG